MANTEDEDDGLDGDNQKTCENCRFYRELMIDQEGECRRYALSPTRMQFGPRRNRHDDYRPEWPAVSADDWCGEFEEHPHKVNNSWQ